MSAVQPYYEHAGIQIWLGDCREILPHVTADVLVTDPPYGVAYQSGWDNALPGIDGDADTSARDAALLAWGARPAIVFGSWKRPRPAGVRALLTWEKGPASGMGDLSLPWKPNTEEVYVLGTGFAGSRDSSVLRFDAPVTWNTSGPTKHGRRLHAHEKPVALMHALIAKCPPGVVLDPFMGSGTTLVAAKNIGRRAIGIEIEERYAEIAARRLEQEVLPFIHDEKPHPRVQGSLLEEVQTDCVAVPSETVCALRSAVPKAPR